MSLDPAGHFRRVEELEVGSVEEIQVGVRLQDSIVGFDDATYKSSACGDSSGRYGLHGDAVGFALCER